MSEVQFIGEKLSLESGSTVRIKKWGWFEGKQFIRLFEDVISDAVRTWGDLKGSPTLDDQEFLDSLAGKAAQLITTSTDTAEKIMIAGLEHGEDDLKKLYGFEDAVDVLLAIIRVNRMVTAVGKARLFIQSLTARSPRPEEQATN